jgi:hypothetical protein
MPLAISMALFDCNEGFGKGTSEAAETLTNVYLAVEERPFRAA